MNNNKFLEKFGIRNKYRNFTLNDRYDKRTFTLTKDDNINNNYNKKIIKTISGKNIKTISISEAIKKMESLKKKYNRLNYQKQINSKIAYNMILKLKKKYFNENNKIENNEDNIKDKNLFKVESIDKITMTNKSWNKKPNYNLILHTSNDLDKKFYTLANDKKNKLQKSNEINYQIRSESLNNINKKKNNKFKFNINLNLYKNYSNKNIKNIRDEFLYLDKKINLLLKDNNINDNDNENDEGTLYNNYNRNRSVCPIKDRIILLTDVKNKIKKINKDTYEENEKTQNSEYSMDSQITLGFKHIKPVIKKEKFFEDYLKDDEPKKDNETISKPILIRSLPRPKLNVPNYPSFFHK